MGGTQAAAVVAGNDQMIRLDSPLRPRSSKTEFQDGGTKWVF
jgi:hypothetical protein